MSRTFNDWLKFFLPEGRAHVERRIELGDYVACPDRAARTYANFAALDATLKGPAYQTLDFDRARLTAEHIAGLPTGIPERFQVTAEQSLAA
jgi:hypothetical protein